MKTDVSALWRCFLRFQRGRKPTPEMEEFRYRLEENLFALETELITGTYRHGPYRVFTVSDAKKRSIAVASVRDRLVHRLIYDYLVNIHDPVFLFDAWSCRTEKGLHRAIDRAQCFLHRFHDGWFWRGDIQKFFDTVDHTILIELLKRRITDNRTLALLVEVIGSYQSDMANGVCFERERESTFARRGIPIGNVTSQIFANIYLHEFDRFVKHNLHVSGYLRYGDDFVLFSHESERLESAQIAAKEFLANRLRMTLHPRNNIVLPCQRGLRFLGYQIFQNGRRLPKRTHTKILRRLALNNASSYRGLILSERNGKSARRFDWRMLSLLDGSESVAVPGSIRG